MKNLKISEELIKAVLQKETETLSKDFNFTINEDYIEFSDDGEMQFEYCIYKFAFKCKEWAYKQKRVNMFIVEADTEDSEINVSVLYGEHHPNLKMHYFNKDNCEIKSTIEACEWILENKDNK